MKRIVTYKLFESSGSVLTQEQEDFLNKHTNGIWKHDPATGLVDVDGDFEGLRQGLVNMKGIKFGKVSGNFDCSYNKLTSLEGAPQKVGEDFYCSGNNLTSLEGAPQEVGGSFDCGDNNLTSLEGAPKKVGGSFFCSYNRLTSLEGAPKKVGGGFFCWSNNLTFLKGAPQKVGGDFDCRNNNLTSLKGAPQEVGGDFDCSYNKLTSLEGAPQKVGGDFDCRNNNLTSLEGAPQEVGGGFICDSFKLGPGKWNLVGWLGILKEGEPKAQSLILTLISPEVLNQEIQKDPGGMIQKLMGVWNDPKFQDIRKQLQFPAEFGDVDKTIKSLKKLDDIKDLI